jgi:hypothetical protein
MTLWKILWAGVVLIPQSLSLLFTLIILQYLHLVAKQITSSTKVQERFRSKIDYHETVYLAVSLSIILQANNLSALINLIQTLPSPHSKA